MTRHFLKLSDLKAQEIRKLISRARQLKRSRRASRPLAGKTLAMLFAKSSTRTRASFEVAMAQLGGHALFLSPRDIQLGRGEPVSDTARVLSSMCDAIMVRNDSQAELEEIAAHSSKPVINGLSDLHHPCQLLADLLTYDELRGNIRGKKVAWIGDGNNVCNSWVEASALLGFELHVACPKDFEPEVAGASVTRKPAIAAAGAHLVVTDVWASMGQEKESARRRKQLSAYRVDSRLMAIAHRKAIFMHCLPAHRGEEVTADVIDGPRSAVWQEAENRLHAQKALLEFLLARPRATRRK